MSISQGPTKDWIMYVKGFVLKPPHSGYSINGISVLLIINILPQYQHMIFVVFFS